MKSFRALNLSPQGLAGKSKWIEILPEKINSAREMTKNNGAAL
jgi:hypothetical protein